MSCHIFFFSALFCMLQTCNQISLQSYLWLMLPMPQPPKISIGTTPKCHTIKTTSCHMSIMKEKKWGNDSSCGNNLKVLMQPNYQTSHWIGINMQQSKTTYILDMSGTAKKPGWGISPKEINRIFSIQMWSSVNNLSNNCLSYCKGFPKNWYHLVIKKR